MASNPASARSETLPCGIPEGCGGGAGCPGRGSMEISRSGKSPAIRRLPGQAPLAGSAAMFDLEFFNCLPPDKRSSVVAQSLVRQYKKGEVLFSKGDPARYVWFVRHGYVKTVKYMSQGRCLTLCYMGPGGIFGTCCIFSERNPYCKNCHHSEGDHAYPCNAVAESEATCVAVPLSLFNEMVDRYPTVSRVMIGQLSERLKAAQESVSFSQESAERRVMRVLWRLTGEFGLEIPMTKREVSEMAGITVETCIRTIKAMERRKLLGTKRGKITILNMQAIHPFHLAD